ncbi:MAG: CAP domain-containing protein [Chthoniobacteraceae bacterium]
MIRLLPLGCAVVVAFTAHGQDLSRVPLSEQAAAARLFKVFREDRTLAEREKALGELCRMHYTVLQAAAPIMDRDWQNVMTAFRAVIPRTAGEVARRRSADPAFKKEVATLRATLAKLRAAGDGLAKEALKTEGGPALERLRVLFTITPADLAAADPAAVPVLDAARAYTRMRSLLQDKIHLANTIIYREADVEGEVAMMLARAFRTDQKTQKILETNAALMAAGAVPADEGEGIRELNEMRILLGLDPVLLDPKLATAARGHSQDMAEKGFFAHESPVPGKKTPSDRAKLAGTTGGAENIFSGNHSPRAANEGWFFSPGHHVNMFGRHRRVGMGRYERHWTQLFGG